MKVIVLGADGMLGHKMFQYLHEYLPQTVGTLHSKPEGLVHSFIKQYPENMFIHNIDAMQDGPLFNELNRIKPDYIINCIGIIKQLSASKESIPSITLNSLLPHKLAQWSAKWGGKLIHFSTDCVFSGKTGGYDENSFSDSNDLYGRTKFLGEASQENALILRTSIIGREVKGFHSLLEWFIAQNNSTVNGFAKAIYSGVTTNYLSSLVYKLIVEDQNINGLYQVSSTPISKLHLLEKIKTIYRLNINIIPNYDFQIDRSLNGRLFESTTGIEIPNWDSMLENLQKDKTSYALWRKNG